jgi:hypothetical protein
MFKSKKTEFWFWFLLGIVNVFTIAISRNSDNETANVIGCCMLVLCFAKSLICAIEIDKEQ